MKNGVNMNALLWRTTKILRYYKLVPGEMYNKSAQLRFKA